MSNSGVLFVAGVMMFGGCGRGSSTTSRSSSETMVFCSRTVGPVMSDAGLGDIVRCDPGADCLKTSVSPSGQCPDESNCQSIPGEWRCVGESGGVGEGGGCFGCDGGGN
jgi:hypothetical protein